MKLKDGSDEPSGHARTVAPPAAEPAEAELVSDDDLEGGTAFLIGDGAVIGRDPNVDVSLSDPEVSRKHARFYRNEAGMLHVEDLGSRNGTYVNDRRLERAPLAFGDILRFGNTALRLAAVDTRARRLDERHRFETIGRLSVGVAHDVRNMLTVLRGNIDIIRVSEGAIDPRELKSCLDDMAAAADRAGEITSRLLDVSREQTSRTNVDVASLCEEVGQLARRAFGAKIMVEVEVERPLLSQGRAAEVYQVLMNLCVNARDAMPRGGTLLITARASETALAGRGTNVIVVRDTGVGMAPDVMARVFDPLFTTKPEGEGTGVGLAAAKRIVERHRGTLSVSSRVGEGTTFTVMLPAVSELPRRSVRTPVVIPERGEGKTVLVVDDEEMVRRAYRRMLIHAGYHVVKASGGAEALARAKELEAVPLLVILDVDLGDRDGVQICEALRAREATAAVIAVTGSDSPDLHERLLRAGAANMLLKPVTRDALLDALAKAWRTRSEPADRMTTTMEVVPGIGDLPRHRRRH